MKKWGNGSRAQITVMWAGSTATHVFIVERINGRNYYMDPQSGETDVEYYLDIAKPHKTSICRIDNADTSELIEYCYKSNTGRIYILN